MFHSLSSRLCLLICALICAPGLFAQTNVLTKFAIPGNPNTNSFGQESCQISPAPGQFGEHFATVGNVLATSGVFEPYIMLTDYDGLNIIEDRVHYVTGTPVHQSATTVCQEPNTGDLYMGLSIISGASEFAYLIKMRADGQVLWGHYWGQGRIRKVLYNDVSKSVVMFGHRSNGRLILAAVDGLGFDPTLGNPYLWRFEDELRNSAGPVPVTAFDMTIDALTGDIAVLGQSRHPGQTNMTVFYHDKNGSILWGGDYGLSLVSERSGAICFGDSNTVAIVGTLNAQTLITAGLDVASGNVQWSTRHAAVSSANLTPFDMEFNKATQEFVVVGQASGATGFNDAMVFTIDQIGNNGGSYFSYNSLYGGFDGNFVLRDVEVESTGEMVMTGSGFHGNAFGVQGGHWFMRTDPTGFEPGFCLQQPNSGTSGYALPRVISMDQYQIPDPPRFDPINDPLDAQQGFGCNGYHTFKTAPADLATELDVLEVQAWPNPASDGINIQVPVSNNEQVGLLVFDITGKTIQVPTDQVSPGRFFVNTRSLPSGTYVALVQSDQQTHRKLFVVE